MEHHQLPQLAISSPNKVTSRLPAWCIPTVHAISSPNKVISRLHGVWLLHLPSAAPTR